MKLCLAILAAGLLAENVVLAQVPSKPGEWPQWRGPNRDGISQETGLLREWPQDGPKVIWQVNSVGVGYSSLSLKDGRIFTQGDLGGVEHVIALDAADGKIIWAVQPEPAKNVLAERLIQEMNRLDRNKDGEVDELEALQSFGWDFNKSDKPAEGEVEPRAKARAEALFARLDQDSDGKLSFGEAGKDLFRDRFEQIDAEDKQADAVKLAASRTAETIKALDKDNDGKVSRKEASGTILQARSSGPAAK